MVECFIVAPRSLPTESSDPSYAHNPATSPMDIRQQQGYYMGQDRGMQGGGSGSGPIGTYGHMPTAGAGQVGGERGPFDDRALFGDIASLRSSNAQQIIDCEQNRVRVPRHLTLDVAGITPDWRSKYALFPRSNVLRSPTNTTSSPQASDAEEEDAEEQDVSASAAPLERTRVPVRLMNGFEADLDVPKITKSRRRRERILNEMGFRMSWERVREFSTPNREPQIPKIMFLQRASKRARSF